mmetsp:Transcript_30639/g.117178  ORF Transcript_30639/g.117178 Transcript_30639/m.117178 type:complete len:246 (-) Transcript_30639:1218-1955(-)
MEAKADMLLERPAMRSKGILFVVVTLLGLLAMLSVSPVRGWDDAPTSYDSLATGSTERTEGTAGEIVSEKLEDEIVFENKPDIVTPATSDGIGDWQIPGQLGAKPEDSTDSVTGVTDAEDSLDGMEQEPVAAQPVGAEPATNNSMVEEPATNNSIVEEPGLAIPQGLEPISSETNESSPAADPKGQSGTPSSLMPGFTAPVTHSRPLPIPDRSENKKTVPACAASLPKAGGYLFMMSAHTGSKYC